MVFLFSLVAVVIPLTHGYSANKSYPSIAVCNQDIVSAIKSHWKNVGKPENVLQRMQEGGLFTLAHTSYDYYNSENKCIYTNYADGILNFTFVHNNGNAAELIYNAEEREDGAFKATSIYPDALEYIWIAYPIYFNHGVLVWHCCGEVEGNIEQEPPITAIIVAGNDRNDLRKSAINEIQSLINGWGLKFKYHYGSECDVKE